MREDLEALRDEPLPELEITETPGADYRFRARTTKHAFARAAAAVAARIDDPNHATHGRRGSRVPLRDGASAPRAGRPGASRGGA